METHPSILAWRIPGTGKPGGLPSIGSHRVGHNWSDLAAAAASAYLRLLIFLPAVLIPACASSSPGFLMMYSAYKLNKHSDNIQPWRTPFPMWNQFVVLCPVLIVASWPAYRFLKSRSQEAGGLVFPSLSEFSTVYRDPHSQRLWHSQESRNRCFSGTLAFLMIQRMLAIWSLVSLPFKKPAWTSGSSRFTYCWSLAWRILSITLLACEMSAIVQ